MMQTLWNPVNFGCNYEVSSEGQVRNIKTGKVLKGTVNEDGYIRVYLSADNDHKSFYVHQLVAEAFLGPCPPGQQVRHWDGNPQNNRCDNLLYGTPEENCKDRDERHGRNGQANKTHCGTCGLPYDEVNTYFYPSGARACRSCVRESGRRYDQRNSEERARRKRERRAAAHNPDILTTGEVADLLNCSTETIRRMCSRGDLPFEQIGTHRRIQREDVMKLLSDLRHS